MTTQRDHARQLVEIHSMMERSSKFVWLSGWAGILAGMYALTGAYVAWSVFDAGALNSITPGPLPAGAIPVLLLGAGIFMVAAASAILFSYQRATSRGEKLWNATSRRLLANMAVPFVAGGLLILVMLNKGLTGFIAPLSLLFYGLALYNVSKYTYNEVRVLGIVEILLGLFSAVFVDFGLFCWALGFGIFHIIYGIYIHYKYEK